MENVTQSYEKDNEDLRFLQLYITVIEEYKRIIVALPIEWDKDVYDISFEEHYAALNVRAFLIRKHINRSENVHIGSIINKAKNVIPREVDALADIFEEFKKGYNENVFQILESGEELDLRKTFDDIVYGLFLHADFERVKRMSLSGGYIQFYCLYKFVASIEKVMFRLYEVLKKHSLSDMRINKIEEAGAGVVLLDKTKNAQKNITGFWRNLYGREASSEEAIQHMLKGKTKTDLQIINYTMNFIENIMTGDLNIDSLKRLVYPSTTYDWGDFSEVKKIIHSFSGLGLGSEVRYNKYKDVAYSKIMHSVEKPLLIEQPHIIENVLVFTFIEDPQDGIWKIYNIGAPTDPIKEKRLN